MPQTSCMHCPGGDEDHYRFGRSRSPEVVSKNCILHDNSAGNSPTGLKLHACTAPGETRMDPYQFGGSYGQMSRSLEVASHMITPQGIHALPRDMLVYRYMVPGLDTAIGDGLRAYLRSGQPPHLRYVNHLPRHQR